MNHIEKKIDAIFSPWQQGLCPGGQVAVRKGGKLIYKKNFGYANLEHKLPVTDETVFHVASVSKQITVMCVLLLQEYGQLQVDDDVREYIPAFINFEEPTPFTFLVEFIKEEGQVTGFTFTGNRVKNVKLVKVTSSPIGRN